MAALKGWVIRDEKYRARQFYKTRCQFRGGPTNGQNLTFPSHPHSSLEEMTAIATQIEGLYKRHHDTQSKDEFVEMLKTTLNNLPNCRNNFLLTAHGLSGKVFGAERTCYWMTKNIELAELEQLARNILYGPMSPDLIDIAERVKIDPTQGLGVILNGTQSDLDLYCNATLEPFTKAAFAAILNGDATRATELIKSSLSVLGGKQAGLNIKSELGITDTPFDRDVDILFVQSLSLFDLGIHTNVPSMMAGLAILLFKHHKCYSQEMMSQLLQEILSKSDGEQSGAVILVHSSDGKYITRGILDDVSLSATRIESVDLFDECHRTTGKIGKFVTDKEFFTTTMKFRKEHEKCPLFVEWSKRVYPHTK